MLEVDGCTYVSMYMWLCVSMYVRGALHSCTDHPCSCDLTRAPCQSDLSPSGINERPRNKGKVPQEVPPGVLLQQVIGHQATALYSPH